MINTVYEKSPEKPNDDSIAITINDNLYKDEEDNESLKPKPMDDSPGKDTVISIVDFTAEPDNLIDLDNKSVTPIKTQNVELTRLFRALPGLTPVQIRILELRYLNLLNIYEKRIRYIDFFHHFTRSFISLGSVAVPALLSIQSPTSPSSVGLYWATWILSLSVTCLHNFVTIFRFEKKYFGLHATYEKLQSEGWYYLQLSGRYSGINGFPHNPPHRIKPTHQNQFSLFVHTIEKIQNKQISDEYNGKSEEKPPTVIPDLTNNPSIALFKSPQKNQISYPESISSPVKKI